MRANSFHGCLTDPPYGLSFMGAQWDHGVPGAETWREVLRVLKPGAFLLAFGGTRTYHRLTCAIEDAGFEIRDCMMWLYGSGFPKAKSCLKPAWEPIILARKPGAMLPLAIDECRIGTTDRPQIQCRNDKRLDGTIYGGGMNGSRSLGTFSLGRWPANVILDEDAARELDAQSGMLHGHGSTLHSTGNKRGLFGTGNTVTLAQNGGDAGGASRFFYCAKASRSERNGNTHPCVKPLKLTEYLARLILPAITNARLLVPFSGSGSEMLGAKRAGWKRIEGIELSAEYAEIAQLRMAA